MNAILDLIMGHDSIEQIVAPQLFDYTYTANDQERDRISFIMRGWRDAFHAVGADELADRVCNLQKLWAKNPTDKCTPSNTKSKSMKSRTKLSAPHL